MLIAIDCGHGCPPDTGASGCGKQEDTLAKNLGFKIAKIIASQGHQVKMVRPSTAKSVNNSLSLRANYANAAKADLYVSIHFNAFSSVSAHGAEVWIHSSSSSIKNRANAVLDNICALGYARRGVKIGNFAVLRLTNMPAMLIECCFITNQKDVDRYDENKVALAIAKGILGSKYIDLGKEKINKEQITLIVTTDTYLKPSTEQSTQLVAAELVKITVGEYAAELVGSEEGHYLIKLHSGTLQALAGNFDASKEYFIFEGHCRYE